MQRSRRTSTYQRTTRAGKGSDATISREVLGSFLIFSEAWQPHDPRAHERLE